MKTEKMNTGLFDKITMIIPTMNRYLFLSRLFRFYESYAYPMQIIVMDTSDRYDGFEVVEKYFNIRQIKYRKVKSEELYMAKIKYALDEIETPYVVICADDDFIIPETVEKCISYLEENRSYSVAHGIYYSHYIEENENRVLEFKNNLLYYTTKSIDQDSPFERIKSLYNEYRGSSFYGVHRTEHMRKMWKEVVDNTSDPYFGELIPQGLSIIFGKLKVFNEPYMFREVIPISKNTLREGDAYIPVRDRADYAQRLDKASCCLARYLAQYDNVDIEVANDFFRKYLERSIAGGRRKSNKRSYLPAMIIDKCLPDPLARKLKTINFKYFDKKGRERKNKREAAMDMIINDGKYHHIYKQIESIVVSARVNVITSKKTENSLWNKPSRP
ncbi:MAG: TIGR00180 family glycosyltransferase [Candidatus Omnitrophica bacterium]|nr:TIGR00180 family glycosyltransferase [Candidatus Omnitrophota bacterium]